MFQIRKKKCAIQYDIKTLIHFVWIICYRRLNFLVKNVHEKVLRVFYDDYRSSYSELVIAKNKSTNYLSITPKFSLKKNLSLTTIYLLI